MAPQKALKGRAPWELSKVLGPQGVQWPGDTSPSPGRRPGLLLLCCGGSTEQCHRPELTGRTVRWRRACSRGCGHRGLHLPAQGPGPGGRAARLLPPTAAEAPASESSSGWEHRAVGAQGPQERGQQGRKTRSEGTTQFQGLFAHQRVGHALGQTQGSYGALHHSLRHPGSHRQR